MNEIAMPWLPVIAAIVIATVTPGVHIPATMVTTVSSSAAKVGDPFAFRTTRAAQIGSVTVPLGSIGYGIITAVSAAAGAHRGSLTLEPEYIVVEPDRHVPVGPETPAAMSYAARRHVFPFPIPVPGVVLVGGVENSGNVTIGPGTSFQVITTSGH